MDAGKSRLHTNFEQGLFIRYWLDEGDLRLSDAQFAHIASEINRLGPDAVSDDRTPLMLGNRQVGYTAQVNFYGSDTYDFAFGSATVHFDMQGRPTGFYDKYDFNASVHRSPQAEAATTKVRRASAVARLVPVGAASSKPLALIPPCDQSQTQLSHVATAGSGAPSESRPWGRGPHPRFRLASGVAEETRPHVW